MSKVFIVTIILLSIVACNSQKKNTKKSWSDINKQLMDINHYLVKEDQDRIKSYLERKKIQMEQTKTGLWYKVLEHGNGNLPKIGDVVVFSYKIELLDGTKCYDSDTIGNKTAKLGFSSIESGLSEGLQLLHCGDKAVFIMPPHLAWGLVGDDNKIPPRSIIVYYVNLMEVKQ